MDEIPVITSTAFVLETGLFEITNQFANLRWPTAQSLATTVS